MSLDDSIADHMPPNAILKQSQARKFQRLLRNLNQLFVKKQPIMQRLFPQCSSCMKLQSAALRHGKSTFVFHFQQGIPQVGSFYSGITSVNFVFRSINLRDQFGFGNRISISEFHPYIVSWIHWIWIMHYTQLTCCCSRLSPMLPEMLGGSLYTCIHTVGS